MLSQEERAMQETVRKVQDIDLRCIRRPTRISKIASGVPRPRNPLPNNPLPKWESIPLEQKFPMIPCPEGQFQLSRSDLGDSLFRNHPKCYNEFDTSDPLIQSTPINYDQLHDPNLKEFYQTHPSVIQTLKSKGLIDETGKVTCTMSDFNIYREYLSRIHAKCIEEERSRQNKTVDANLKQVRSIKQFILKESRAQKEAVVKSRIAACRSQQARRDLAAQLKEMGHPNFIFRETLARERAFKSKGLECLKKLRSVRIARLRSIERERQCKMVLEWYCKELYADQLRQSVTDYNKRLRQAELNEFVKSKREYQTQSQRYERAILLRQEMEHQCGISKRREYYESLETNRLENIRKREEARQSKRDRKLYLLKKYATKWLSLVRDNQKKTSDCHDPLFNIRHQLRQLVSLLKNESGVVHFTSVYQGLVNQSKPKREEIKMDNETKDVINYILHILLEGSFREYLRKKTSCAIDFFNEKNLKKMAKHNSSSKDPVQLEDFLPPTTQRHLKPLFPYEKPPWPCGDLCKPMSNDDKDWKRRCGEMAKTLNDVHNEITNYLKDSMCRALEKQLSLDELPTCSNSFSRKELAKTKKEPCTDEDDICLYDEMSEEANYFADEEMKPQVYKTEVRPCRKRSKKSANLTKYKAGLGKTTLHSIGTSPRSQATTTPRSKAKTTPRSQAKTTPRSQASTTPRSQASTTPSTTPRSQAATTPRSKAPATTPRSNPSDISNPNRRVKDAIRKSEPKPSTPTPRDTGTKKSKSPASKQKPKSTTESESGSSYMAERIVKSALVNSHTKASLREDSKSSANIPSNGAKTNGTPAELKDPKSGLLAEEFSDGENVSTSSDAYESMEDRSHALNTPRLGKSLSKASTDSKSQKTSTDTKSQEASSIPKSEASTDPMSQKDSTTSDSQQTSTTPTSQASTDPLVQDSSTAPQSQAATDRMPQDASTTPKSQQTSATPVSQAETDPMPKDASTTPKSQQTSATPVSQAETDPMPKDASTTPKSQQTSATPVSQAETDPMPQDASTTPKSQQTSATPVSQAETDPMPQDASTTPQSQQTSATPVSQAETEPMPKDASTTPQSQQTSATPVSQAETDPMSQDASTPKSQQTSATPVSQASTDPMSQDASTTPQSQQTSATPVSQASTDPMSQDPSTSPQSQQTSKAPVSQASTDPMSEDPSTSPQSQQTSIAPVSQASTDPMSEDPSTSPTSQQTSATPVSQASTDPMSQDPSTTPQSQQTSIAPVSQASTDPMSEDPSTSPTSQQTSTTTVSQASTDPMSQDPSTSPQSQQTSKAPMSQAETDPMSQDPSTSPQSQQTSKAPVSEAETDPMSQEPSTSPQSQQTSATPVSQAETDPMSQEPSTSPQSQQTSVTPVSQAETDPMSQEPSTSPTSQQTLKAPVSEAETDPMSQDPSTSPQSQQTSKAPVSQAETDPMSQDPSTSPQSQQTSKAPVSQASTDPMSEDPSTSPKSQQTSATPVSQAETDPMSEPSTSPMSQQTSATPVSQSSTDPMSQETSTTPQSQQTSTAPASQASTDPMSQDPSTTPKSQASTDPMPQETSSLQQTSTTSMSQASTDPMPQETSTIPESQQTSATPMSHGETDPMSQDGSMTPKSEASTDPMSQETSTTPKLQASKDTMSEDSSTTPTPQEDSSTPMSTVTEDSKTPLSKQISQQPIAQASTGPTPTEGTGSTDPISQASTDPTSQETSTNSPGSTDPLSQEAPTTAVSHEALKTPMAEDLFDQSSHPSDISITPNQQKPQSNSEPESGSSHRPERTDERPEDALSPGPAPPSGDDSRGPQAESKDTGPCREGSDGAKVCPSSDVNAWVDDVIDGQLKIIQQEKDVLSAGDEAAIDSLADDENLERITSMICMGAICKQCKVLEEERRKSIEVCPSRSRPRVEIQDSNKPKDSGERKKKDPLRSERSMLDNIAAIGLGAVVTGRSVSTAASTTHIQQASPRVPPVVDRSSRSPGYQQMLGAGTSSSIGVFDLIATVALGAEDTHPHRGRTARNPDYGSVDVTASESMMLLPRESIPESIAGFRIPTADFVQQHTYPVESENSTFGLSVHPQPAESHIRTLGNETVTPSIALLDEQRNARPVQVDLESDPPIETLFRQTVPEVPRNTALIDQSQPPPLTSNADPVPRTSGDLTSHRRTPTDLRLSVLEQLSHIKQEIESMKAQLNEAVNDEPPQPPT